MRGSYIIESIGRSCRIWRNTMGYSIAQVIKETGYTASTITLFEQGKNNNAVLFLWYIARGFNPERDFIDLDSPITKQSATRVFDNYLTGV